MKLNRKIFVIISVFCLFSHWTFALSDARPDYSDVSVLIRYEDRTVYYPEETDTNPVKVHITIKNNGYDTLRFKLADNRFFSIDFSVYTVKNSLLPQTENLIQSRTTNQTVYTREIALEHGEEYSFTENLKEYIQISEPSVYYVEVKFYPELFKSKYISLSSNRLTLEVRPSPQAASSSFVPVKAKSVEVLTPLDLSPDKVVEQTIIARQKSLWDQFFLYMDIPSMLQRNAGLKRRYNSVSADERERMLENFKKDLMQSRIDNDIVSIPEKFQIEKTTYTPSEGVVVVTEWFKYPNFYEKKSYSYKVRQREGVWQIYDYTVTNLGTE